MSCVAVKIFEVNLQLPLFLKLSRDVLFHNVDPLVFEVFVHEVVFY